MSERIVRRSYGDPPVLRESDKDSKYRNIEGYAILYGQWIDAGFGNREMDVAGLFDESLANNPEVVLALNHRDFFASTWNGTLQLRSDDKGLWFEAQLDSENPKHKQLLLDMESGLLRQASAKFFVEEQETEEREDGTDFRYTKADLNYGDVSSVVWGANENAYAEIRQSLETDVGRQVLRSLGYELADRPGLRGEHVIELAEELVDTTADAEPTSDLWLLRTKIAIANARLKGACYTK